MVRYYGGGGVYEVRLRLQRRYRNLAQQLTDKDKVIRTCWTGTARTRKGLEPAVWMTCEGVGQPDGESVYFCKHYYTSIIRETSDED